MPSLGHGGDAGHNCGTAGEGGEGEGRSGRELAHASRMLGLDPVAAVYLNYTYYINILEDAYGCWSLTVHSCVNTYTLL